MTYDWICFCVCVFQCLGTAVRFSSEPDVLTFMAILLMRIKTLRSFRVTIFREEAK